MKKLLSALLCIVFICTALVGCGKDIIGEYLENYNTNTVTDDDIANLNFYIIGDEISSAANTTVPQNINTYLKEKYRIALNIVYSTEAEYENTVNQALKSVNEKDRPDIILVNSKEFFNGLYSANNLVALNNWYNKPEFKTINTIVDDVLLSASAVEEQGNSVYYTVPNNHVIGEYKYIVIDKTMARDIINTPNSKIAEMTHDGALAELKNAIIALGEDPSEYIKTVTGDYMDKILLEYGIDKSDVKNIVNIKATTNRVSDTFEYIVINKAMAVDTLGYTVDKLKLMTTEASLSDFKADINKHFGATPFNMDDYVKIVKGNFDSKIVLEYGIDTTAVKKNFVNINSYPTATEDEAFKSAFAIVKSIDDKPGITDEERAAFDHHYTDCMSIIYALNTDVELKNMLQYGYRGTNYKFVTNDKNENTNYIRLITDPSVVYKMNPIYTGNQFISYYCDDISWDETIYNAYIRQNAEAKTTNQKLLAEEVNLSIPTDDVVNGSEFYLTDYYGKTYSDVVISWTSNEYAVIDNASGKVSFVNNTDNAFVTAVIKANISCCGKTVVKEFNIKVHLLPAQKLQVAYDALTLELEGNATPKTKIELPLSDSNIKDVEITWSTENEYATIDNKKGILSFKQPEEDTVVVIKAELVCGDEKV